MLLSSLALLGTPHLPQQIFWYSRWWCILLLVNITRTRESMRRLYLGTASNMVQQNFSRRKVKRNVFISALSTKNQDYARVTSRVVPITLAPIPYKMFLLFFSNDFWFKWGFKHIVHWSMYEHCNLALYAGWIHIISHNRLCCQSLAVTEIAHLPLGRSLGIRLSNF